MSDLIRRSDAVKVIDRMKHRLVGNGLTYEFMRQMILEIPNIEPKRGEWLWDNGYFCSECRVEAIKFPLDTEPPMYLKTAFCPTCGADLRGGHNE